MANGRSSPDTRTTIDSRYCQATLAYQSIPSAKCDLAFLHCSLLFDLLLWDVYTTSACNSEVGRRSWKACMPHFRPLRPKYMCTAATIEYSLSLGFWYDCQPLLIAIQLVCDHRSESERWIRGSTRQSLAGECCKLPLHGTRYITSCASVPSVETLDCFCASFHLLRDTVYLGTF